MSDCRNPGPCRYCSGIFASLTIRGKTGYTGEPPQSRADLLKHTMFRDMKMKVFAKQSAAQWVELSETPIVRQLLTR